MTDSIVRIRSTPNSNFTMVPNEAIDALEEENPRALALLVRLLRRPPDWNIRVSQLAQKKKDQKTKRKSGLGEDAVRSDLNVLKNLGYVKFTREQDEYGHWICYYDVYCEPYKKPSQNASKAKKTSNKKGCFQKFIPHRSLPDQANTDVILKRSIQKDPPPSSPLPETLQQSRPEAPVSLRSEEDDFLHECLKETVLSPSEKKRLSKQYAEADVERALRISKTQTVKKSLMGLLVNILQNPDKWNEQGKIPPSPKQEKAEKYNEKLKQADPELHKKNKESIPKGYVHVLDPVLKHTTLSMKADDFERDLADYEKWLEKKLAEKCPRLKDPP